jgi:hypothetical protein
VIGILCGVRRVGWLVRQLGGAARAPRRLDGDLAGPGIGLIRAG